MAEIVVEGVSKTYGRGVAGQAAVDGISFEVPDGQLLVLLGPSGCGKTTTLRCLAGLEEPDAGRIRFGDQVVYDQERKLRVPTHRRDIGLVFQSFALWPHLSARANIEFPLKSRHVSGPKRKAVVEAMANLVDLNEALLAQYPGQLSGGQQQRVALARALSVEPAVLLFDEPLSNLDANLREQLRVELRALHDRLRFTGVYVTHDLTEALALGDRVAVMAKGKLEQIGTPAEVFQFPATTSLAEFLGLRRLPAHPDLLLGLVAYARPQVLTLANPEDAPRPNHLRLEGGVLQSVSFLGDHFEAAVAFGGQAPLRVQAGKPQRPNSDAVPAAVDVPLSSLLLYQEDGRLASQPTIPVRR
jgi:iron(III) transport system ATP-binding protein